MAQTLYPTFRYADAHAAMEWLERTLGFERGQVHESEDGAVAHAELSFRGSWIMLGSAGDAADEGRLPGEFGPSLTYIAVDEVDSLHDRARDAGAHIRMPLTDTDYGSRDFAVSDPEGNVWSFGTYRVDG